MFRLELRIMHHGTELWFPELKVTFHGPGPTPGAYTIAITRPLQ